MYSIVYAHQLHSNKGNSPTFPGYIWNRQHIMVQPPEAHRHGTNTDVILFKFDLMYNKSTSRWNTFQIMPVYVILFLLWPVRLYCQALEHKLCRGKILEMERFPKPMSGKRKVATKCISHKIAKHIFPFPAQMCGVLEVAHKWIVSDIITGLNHTW